MKKVAVSLEKVSFSFNQTPVLEDVTLNINYGDFIGVIGPNGGGKTTLLKLITSLIEPDKGQVHVLGKNPKDIRAKIGYVPQSSNIDKNFPISLLELVLLGCLSKTSLLGRYKKDIFEKAKYLLEKMGLYHLRNHPFGLLSGGETQRALIARALICDPEILVLDEPTANIDIAAEHKVFDLLLKHKGSKTIIMVSHDLEIIIEYVKNIIFVKRSVTTTLPEKVCEHFALGLYHKPYLKK